MSFFDNPLQVRMTRLEQEKMKHIVEHTFVGNQEPKYESVSHFVRCAVNNLVRKEEELFMLTQRKGVKQNGRVAIR